MFLLPVVPFKYSADISKLKSVDFMTSKYPLKLNPISPKRYKENNIDMCFRLKFLKASSSLKIKSAVNEIKIFEIAIIETEIFIDWLKEAIQKTKNIVYNKLMGFLKNGVGLISVLLFNLL